VLSKQTVFILGAGASAPFGFSTGKKQLDDARLLVRGCYMTSLGDIRVRNARPRDRAYKPFDGRGLFLLVTPPGGRQALRPAAAN